MQAVSFFQWSEVGQVLRFTRYGWIVFATLLVGCAGQRTEETEFGGRLVCDTMFLYEMCAHDMTGSGEVDLLYFSDSSEVFMYREGMSELVTQVMPLHPCAVAMPPEIVDVSSRLMYATEDMGTMERLDLKRRLISNYMGARPTIDACMEQAGGAPSQGAEDDDFGDDDEMVDF